MFLVESLVSTSSKLLGSNEGIKLVSTDGKFIGTILGNVYGITFGLDVVHSWDLKIDPFLVLMMAILRTDVL